jgi:hypothetical protein
VWKDVDIASSLLLAVSLLFYAHLRSSALALGLALVPFFYGLAVRHNAALAVYPLALWAGLIADRLTGGRSKQRPLRSIVKRPMTFKALLAAKTWSVLIQPAPLLQLPVDGGGTPA